MRLVRLENLQVGDTLAKSVYDDRCALLLAKGVELNEYLIERLIRASIYCVYIDDELSEGIEIENVVSDEIRLQSVREIKKVFDDIHVGQGVRLKEKNIENIRQIIDDILDDIMRNRDALYVMSELMGTDMYTFKHSTEVAILSILIAQKFGMAPDVIRKIGMGAMLHDIGKVNVPNDILNKPEKLTPEEFQIIKEHARQGYELLKDSYSISPMSRQIILLHHEKLDGSGYPLGLSEDGIPLHVRIVSMCDVFNALISERSYRHAKSIDDALEILRTMVVYELDATVYHSLVEVINIYPPGTFVELTDGRKGIVIRANKAVPTRPVVQIIENNVKKELLDLMGELTLFVKQQLDVLT